MILVHFDQFKVCMELELVRGDVRLFIVRNFLIEFLLILQIKIDLLIILSSDDEELQL